MDTTELISLISPKGKSWNSVSLVGKGVSEHGCLCLLISNLVSKRKEYESLSVFKPAHLRSDNPTAETEAKKESQVAEEDNEVIKQLKKTQANISI